MIKRYEPNFTEDHKTMEDKEILQEQELFAYKEMFSDFLKSERYLAESYDHETWARKGAPLYRKMVNKFLSNLSLSEEEKKLLEKFLVFKVQVAVMKVLGVK